MQFWAARCRIEILIRSLIKYFISLTIDKNNKYYFDYRDLFRAMLAFPIFLPLNVCPLY